MHGSLFTYFHLLFFSECGNGWEDGVQGAKEENHGVLCREERPQVAVQ
jgi:hypothetical protein